MNLQIMSPIGYTGYGYAALNIIKSLHHQDNLVGLSLIGNPNVDNEEDRDIVKSCLDNQINISYDAPSVKIWHQFDLLSHVGRGKYYAFPFFEVDKLPTNEIYHINSADEVIVSCEWAKQVLLSNSITKPINVVPLGVDRNIFKPPSENIKPKENYVFCSIGKWEKRKAHDTIIECFNKAFDTDDNVELWLLTHNGFLNQQQEHEWLSLVNTSKLKNKIKVFPRLPSHHSVAETISYTDCGIYISRGEGWNLELLETMSMGKPVIVSNYSAHTEYCNSDNSFLVDMNATEPAIDNKWFFGKANWGKIDKQQIEQTVEHMRYVYKKEIRQNPSGILTANNYTWTHTAEKLVKILE